MPAWLVYIDVLGRPSPRILFGYPGAIKPEFGETEKKAERIGREVRLTSEEEDAVEAGALTLGDLCRRYPVVARPAVAPGKIVLGAAHG